MGERALGWGLRLLGIALFIGPFIAAFAVHNWDFKAALMPSQAEIDEVKGMLSGLFGEGFSPEKAFTVETSTLDGTAVRITVGFTSPFNLPVKIMDISCGVSCQHNVRLASVQMEKKGVEIQPKGTATFALIGTLTQEGNQHILVYHGGAMPDDFNPTDLNFELEFYGATLKLSMKTMQGGYIYPPPSEGYVCPWCGQEFETLEELDAHMAEHPPEG